MRTPAGQVLGRVLGVGVCRVGGGLGGMGPATGLAGMVRLAVGTLVGPAGVPWARGLVGGLGLWEPSCWWWLRWRRPG
jgi:hypothetical protein